MAGDLSRRVPLTRANDEFDALATNLNSDARPHRAIDARPARGHRFRRPRSALAAQPAAQPHRRRLYAGSIPKATRPIEIEAAVAETDHLIATFNALLLIAEAEAGVVREAMTLVDLSGVVEGVAELYAPVAEEKAITLDRRAAAIRCRSRPIAAWSPRRSPISSTTPSNTRPKAAGSRIAVEERPDGVALSVADTRPRHSRRRSRPRRRSFRASGDEPQFARHRAGPEPRCRRGAPA